MPPTIDLHVTIPRSLSAAPALPVSTTVTAELAPDQNLSPVVAASITRTVTR